MQSENEKLVAEFEAFLQQGELFSPDDNVIQQPAQQVDLYQLFSELSALKTEVKQDARQQKEALGHFTGVLDTLQSGNKQLTKELGRHDDHQKKAVIQAKKDLLSEMIDINDRLQATLVSMDSFKAPLIERKTSRDFRLGLQEGLGMTLRRLEQLLKGHEVSAIEVIGKAVDPHTMRVSEIVEDKHQADGMVLEEVQRGYLYQGTLLRLAEVVANKRAP